MGPRLKIQNLAVGDMETTNEIDLVATEQRIALPRGTCYKAHNEREAVQWQMGSGQVRKAVMKPERTMSSAGNKNTIRGRNVLGNARYARYTHRIAPVYQWNCTPFAPELQLRFSR